MFQTFEEWLEDHPEFDLDEVGWLPKAALTGAMALGMFGNQAKAADTYVNRANTERPAASAVENPVFGQSMDFYTSRPDPSGGIAYIYKFKGYTNQKRCADEALKHARNMILNKTVKGGQVQSSGTIEGLNVAGIKETPGLIWVKVLHNPNWAKQMSEPPAPYR